MERGAENRVGAESIKYSDNVLLVCYKDVFMTESGLYGRLMESLKTAGMAVFEVSDILPNPRLDSVYRGIDLCRRHKIGFILAVGGGSVIDTAKAVSIGTNYDGDVWDFYTGKSVPENALPVGVVMTLPATGSEASNGSVITNERTGEKRDVMGDVLRPVFVLMNPEISFTVPRQQTACGVADMFSHVTERYFSTSLGNALTDRLCEGVMKAIVECGSRVMENPRDYDVRANLMWASILAHNGLLGVGRKQDWSTHMMAAAIGGEYGTVHGATIAVLLPVWAEYVMGDCVDRFVQFANRVFGVDIDLWDRRKAALEGIMRLKSFYHSTLGLASSLRDLGLKSSEKFGVMAERACFGGVVGCVKPLSAADILQIFEKAF
jgi:alcohol dehydrogenase YqhD (iron-dependent ADH family)